MNINNCPAYELIEEKNVADLNSKGYRLLHKKTGARVLILENDDENKVFYIGFRTPPYDSTGLPHIMEHSVLCGSKKYPVKDPFVELAKGSLNTFLNAMTFPDKTVYPVASCNSKDFKNLMNVYLDAVFYPNIYSHEEIFRQEGWHYELNDKDDELTVNGVVYNEMKGAFSSPDDVLDRKIFESLFPDTCYGVESGGDPDVIPTLSYDKFLDFHRAYYHPSNSYIYLYGNADMESLLDFIDKDYLSDYDKKEIDSTIGLQKSFETVKDIKCEYSITEDEPLQNNTYLSYNSVIETSLDKELYLAFQIIDYALLAAPGAVLKQALLDRGICKDVDSTYENGIYQPYFSVIARNSDEEKKEEFLATIREVLDDVVKKGFDKKTLLAGINVFEFKYREADFGAYPKGLMYGLQSFDSWLYDDEKPFLHIEANDTFAFLKEMVNGTYFEDLVSRYLLNNNHSSIVTLVPKQSLNAQKDAKLAQTLAEYKNALSDEEARKIVDATSALKHYQEEDDAPEDLEKLPLLSIDDIEKKAMDFINRPIQRTDGLVLKHDIFTNGIGYIRLVFDMNKVPDDLIPYFGILKNVLGLMDTKNYTYADLASEINLNSGGIIPGSAMYIDVPDPQKYTLAFEIKAKVLYDKVPFAFEMFKEILYETNFDDDKRLCELINMLKSRMQGSMMGAGHSFSAMRAMSHVSETARIAELMNGITFYRLVEKLASDYEGNKQVLKNNLKKCLKLILTKDNLILADYTAEESVTDDFVKEFDSFVTTLANDKYENASRGAVCTKEDEGYKTSGKVQYVAKGGLYIDDNHPYTGALKILKVIMGYDYLWNNVRVQGGAYGCFSSFTRSGEAYFVSYRDPNLKGTLDIYDNADGFVEKFDADEREMTQFIIGTISDLDIPLSPSAKGTRSLGAYLAHDSYESVQRERNQIIEATPSDIRELSSYIRNAMANASICVLGGEEVIKKEESLFDNIEPLFKS